MINILCDRALLIGYADHIEQLDLPEIRRAGKEVRRHRSGFSVPGQAVWLLLLIPLIFLVFWVFPRTPITPTQDKTNLTVPVLNRFASEILPELRKTTAAENRRNAVNSLLSSWGGQPITTAAATMEESLNLSRAQKFEVARLQGDLDGLLHLRLPLLLEVGDATDVRYLLLLGRTAGGVKVALANGRMLTVPPAQLAPYWQNRAYLLWRNPLDLPISQGPIQTTREIVSLQTLLNSAGKSVPLSGRYDEKTSAAIRTFQLEQQLSADGIAGMQTLIALYRQNQQYGYPLQLWEDER